MVEVARGATQQGRHDEALELLDRAQQQVLAGLTRLLHASTLDYTMRPANPAEEFEIELARHRSLVDLLPLALDQLKPGRDASALMARYHAASQTLLAQAIQQYESANLSRALVHLRDATSQLQRALAAAGVATPVPTSNTP